MDDSQWCLDECPTCATVVHGRSIYCSPKCEPEVKPEPELENDDVQWTQCNSIRVSAWALDCYKSALGPASSPGIFPSPSQRKLHIRKKHPTSWVTSDTSSHSPPYISPSISTGTAVESLITNSTPPQSPWSVRSWRSSPGPATPPLLTKTNVYLFSDSITRPPTTRESNEISDRPVSPSDPCIRQTVEKATCGRSSRPMLGQPGREYGLGPQTTYALLHPPPA
ncbi:hypothetical protein MVEN_00754600 [Mycena venus]|uniref:Uncharacterized protein n=1 Tax=Mycena venus TaxID=2733690 RepID=A0A8H6YKB0_9AGAR|nr:hypothetical protein MVEN_00754600 [Mycena venus]